MFNLNLQCLTSLFIFCNPLGLISSEVSLKLFTDDEVNILKLTRPATDRTENVEPECLTHDE